MGRKIYTKNIESLNDNYKIAVIKNATSPASQLKCNVYNLWLEEFFFLTLFVLKYIILSWKNSEKNVE